MYKSRFYRVLATILAIAILTSAGSALTMVLWNAIIPGVCGFQTINFVEALGLLALGLTLSGGITIPLAAMLHLLHPGHRKRSHELRERWKNMSDEDRRAFMAARGFTMHDKQ